MALFTNDTPYNPEVRRSPEMTGALEVMYGRSSTVDSALEVLGYNRSVVSGQSAEKVMEELDAIKSENRPTAVSLTDQTAVPEIVGYTDNSTDITRARQRVADTHEHALPKEAVL